MLYSNATIADLFEKQVQKRPNDIALVCKNKQLTYKELNTEANQLAHCLINLGVHNESIVGIYLNRSLEAAISMLSILKAGGAYFSLDKNSPEMRLNYILHNANPKVIISKNSNLQFMKKNNQCNIINLDDFLNEKKQFSTENPKRDSDINSMAYLIYTSGSTGKPKGVEVLNKGVVHLLHNLDDLTLDNTCIFLQIASIGFDAATFEIWGALLHGGQCVIFSEKHITLKTLSNEIEKHKVNTILLTPALFNLIMDESPQILTNIKRLVVGGEKPSVKHIVKALKLLPNATILNAYGPTENTVITTYENIKDLKPQDKSIAIGYPIGNNKIAVLDENLKPVAPGEIGELYVGGDGLARGYHKDTKLTNERFITNKIASLKCDRLYKTGDLVYSNKNGKLIYVSRNDTQVKITGIRVELSEIENQLVKHPEIYRATVLLDDTDPNDKKLIAYIVSKKNEIDINEIKNYLKERLPAYMLPQAIYRIKKFPLTISGKINRIELLNQHLSKRKASNE